MINISEAAQERLPKSAFSGFGKVGRLLCGGAKAEVHEFISISASSPNPRATIENLKTAKRWFETLSDRGQLSILKTIRRSLAAFSQQVSPDTLLDYSEAELKLAFVRLAFVDSIKMSCEGSPGLARLSEDIRKSGDEIRKSLEATESVLRQQAGVKVEGFFYSLSHFGSERDLYSVLDRETRQSLDALREIAGVPKKPIINIPEEPTYNERRPESDDGDVDDNISGGDVDGDCSDY